MTESAAQQLQVLLIEDNPGDARLIREMLAESAHGSWRLDWAARLSDGLAKLADTDYDAILLDLSLPDSQGLETFAGVDEASSNLPIVVLSGLADEAVAIGAVNLGAQDYLVKGQVDSGLLARSLRYAIERKHLQQQRAELQVRERAAEIELARQKDEFFANVSHDLRTPLFAIKVSIGVVLANEPPATPEPIHRLLENIDAATDQLGRLVDDLIELTRLQAGRIQLQMAECDLKAIVESAARSVEPLTLDSGQRVVIKVPTRPILVVGDAVRLERAISNLLSNATKYGGSNNDIEVRLRRSRGLVTLAVSDQGPGISPDEHELIFDRFYRSRSHVASGQPGSGLGLPIARAMVELHGGRLWVESEPGAGATFWITLPAKLSASGVRGGESESGEDPSSR